MARKRISILLLFCLMGSLFAGVNVSGTPDIYSIFFSFEPRAYEIGEVVQINATIYHDSVKTDVDEVIGNVLIVNDTDFSLGRSVTFNSIGSPGMYQYNFTVMDSDVSQSNGTGIFPVTGYYVFLSAGALVGSTYVADGLIFVRVRSAPMLQVDISNHHPDPGDVVNLDISFFNGTFVSPTAWNVTLYNFTQGIPDLMGMGLSELDMGEALTAVPNGTGRLAANYTIPIGLTNATEYIVIVNASFGSEYTNSFEIMQLIFPPEFRVDFYQIYLHNVSWSPTQLISELYVTDKDNVNLSGVNLDINLLYDNGTTVSINNITNGNGMAGITIGHDPSTNWLALEGWANLSGKSQYFSEMVIENDTISPESDEFEIVMHDDFDPTATPSRGDLVNWTYRAFFNYTVLPNQEILYWIHNETSTGLFPSKLQLIQKGLITTDPEGDFFIEFVIPINLDRLSITARSNISGNPKEATGDTFLTVLDENLKVSIDELSFGGQINVTARTDVSNNSMAFLIFAPFLDLEIEDLEWFGPLIQGSTFPTPYIMKRTALGTFESTVNLPNFYPPERDYLFFVLIFDRETFDVRSNFLVMDLTPPRIKSAEPEGSDISLFREVIIEFDEPMNTTSVEDALNISSSGLVPLYTLGWSLDDTILRIVWDDPLEYGSDYIITINGSVAKNRTGSELDGNGNGKSEGSLLDDFLLIFTTVKFPSSTDDYDLLWHKSDFNINLTGHGGEGGVVELFYRINSGSTLNISNDGMPLIILEGENNTLEYWSMDSLDKKEFPHNFLTNIKLDKTDPESTDDYVDIWKNKPFLINLTGTDTLSGVEDIYYKINGTPPVLSVNINGQPVIDSEGMSLEFWSLDNASNKESSHILPNIKLDLTAPSTTNDYDGQLETENFTINLTSTDNLSGVFDTYYKINGGITQSVSSDGQPYITTVGNNITLEYWSVDNVTNGEIPILISGIRLSTILPVVVLHNPTGVNISPQANASIEFSVPMNKASVEAALEVITTGNSFNYTTSWSADNKTMNIMWDDFLDYDTQYDLRVFGSIAKDLKGSFLDGDENGVAEGSPIDDHLWSFTIAPLPTSTDDYNGLWHTLDFTVTLVAIGGDGGIQDIFYKVNNGTVQSVKVDGQPFIDTDGALNIIEYWAEDNAGTVEDPPNLIPYIQLDTSLPNTSDDYTNEWRNSSFVIELISDDSVSGVNETYYRYDVSGPIFTVGENGFPLVDMEGMSLEYWAVDNATNEESHEFLSNLKLDITPPTTSHDYDGTWKTETYTINLTATDTRSGSNWTYYRINSGPIQEISQDGQPLIDLEGDNITLEFWSIDRIGNEEPHFMITAIKLDLTDPTVIMYAPQGNSVPLDANVTIQFSESMNLTTSEGAFSISPSLAGIFSWEDDTKLIFDPNADFPEEVSYSVSIDASALDLNGRNLVPFSWSFQSYGPPPLSTTHDYDGLWRTVSFTIILTTMGGSGGGVNDTFYRINGGSTQSVSQDGQPQITGEGDSNTLEYWSTDLAGNREGFRLLKNIKLDTLSGPVETEANHNDIWHTSDFAINLTSSGRIGGVQDTFYKINDGPVQSVSEDGNPMITIESNDNTLEFWSVDEAGNEEEHQEISSIKLDKTAPNEPTPDELPETTDSEILEVGINTDPFATVRVYVNDQLVDTGKADSDGNYITEIKLSEGENIIRFDAVDEAGNEIEGDDFYTVTYLPSENKTAGRNLILPFLGILGAILLLIFLLILGFRKGSKKGAQLPDEEDINIDPMENGPEPDNPIESAAPDENGSDQDDLE